MSRDRRVVLAATLAGIGAALVVTLLQESTYRASGVLVLTREGRAPGDDPTLAPAAAAAIELLETPGVAESVAANLRLDDSPEELLDRIDADAGAQSSLLRLSVEGEDRQEARRIGQELAEVFTVLYNTRFGPGVTVSIWEAPRAEEERVSPRPVRNLMVGALVGALAGALVGPGLGSLPRRRRWKEAVVSPEPSGVEPAAQPQRAAFVRPQPGSWTLGDVEALVAEQGGAFPERREDFDVYLASFRDVAGPDGQLPAGVEIVVEDVFADLIEAHGRSPGDGTVPLR